MLFSPYGYGRDGTRRNKRRAATPKPIRPTLKRWTTGSLLDAVRAIVVEVRDSTSTYPFVTAEAVANHLRARKGMITNCFRSLNKEGLLRQGSNRPPSDCNRGWGTGSAWTPTTYLVVRK